MPEQPPRPPVPPHVLALSQSALDLHDPNLRVITLAADSLLDEDVAIADDAERRLRFERDGVRVDVALRCEPTGARLHVQVDPDGGDVQVDPAGGDYGSLELVQPGGVVARRELRSGEVDIDEVPPGLTHLVLRGRADPAATSVRTAWFTI